MPGKKFSSGQSLGAIRDSRWLNFVNEGAELAHGMPFGTSANSAAQPRTTVLIRNDASVLLKRFWIAGVNDMLFTPGTDVFQNHFAFAARVPGEGDGAGRIGIIQSPIAPGKMGPALFWGATPVKLLLPDNDDFTAAKIIDGEPSMLEADNAGDIVVIWHEEGPGEKWAVVNLGAGAGGTPCAPLHELSVEGHPTAGTCTWRYQIESVNGDIELEFDSTAAAAQAAFELHSALSTDLVEVTGGPLPHVALYVEFAPEVDQTAVPILVDNSLTAEIDDPFDPQPKLRLR
jgi:hypothetical protein